MVLFFCCGCLFLFLFLFSRLNCFDSNSGQQILENEDVVESYCDGMWCCRKKRCHLVLRVQKVKNRSFFFLCRLILFFLFKKIL